MTIFYQFAGIAFELVFSCPEIKRDSRMEQFQISEPDIIDMRIDVCVRDELTTSDSKEDSISGNIKLWDEGHRREWVRGSETYICFYLEDEAHGVMEVLTGNEHLIYTEMEIWNHIPFESILLDHGVTILHSSYLKYKNQAILFFGPSGVGKSTQAELWRNIEGATIVNGDRSLITCLHEHVTAHGLPICGSSQYCENQNGQICAIVYLGQGKDNVLTRLSKAEAIKKLFGEMTINMWNSRHVDVLLDILETITEHVPVYHFICNKDGSSVDLLKRELFGDDYAESE